MKNLIKNMIPYVVASSVATFIFGPKYGVLLCIALLPMFIMYYITLGYAVRNGIKDKRMGDVEKIYKGFWRSTLVTYAFTITPVILGFILELI